MDLSSASPVPFRKQALRSHTHAFPSELCQTSSQWSKSMSNLNPTGWENRQDIKTIEQLSTSSRSNGKEQTWRLSGGQIFSGNIKLPFWINSIPSPRNSTFCVLLFWMQLLVIWCHQSNSCCANRALHFLETSPDHQCHLHHRQELANRRSWRMCGQQGWSCTSWRKWISANVVLLMAEILHHQGCMKPYQ